MSGALLVALGLFTAREGFAMGLGHGGEPGAGFMPFWLGLGLVACGAVIVASARTAPTADPGWPTAERRRHMLRVVGALVAYFGLMAPLGFPVATFLFLGYLFRAWGRYPWWLCLVLAVGLAWGLHWVFDTWLGTNLPRAAWPLP